MWQTIFAITNWIALAGWFILIVLPRRPLPMALVLYGGVMMLCFAYAAMLVALLTQMVDPVPVSGFEPNGLSYSIEGLRQLFLSDGGIILGWTHYLAFDLFVGLWIARDANAKNFSRWVQVPILLATFLAGPLGLFIWLIVREKRARKSATA